MKTKRIRIGSHDWTVRYVENIVDDDGTTPLNGATYQDERLIEIDRKLSKDDQGLILLHESIHAALFEIGLHELIGDEIEEVIARGLSNTLWPLVRSGKLVK
jgi:hypothetical protein